MKTIFRNNGAVGALLDEYEKAINELNETISNLTPEQISKIVDTETKDLDCRSIQTILSHLVKSGYGYAIATRKHLGEALPYKKTALLNTVEEYATALNEMFTYNEQLFIDYPNIQLNEKRDSHKVITSWGQRYDVDQLFEHAIMHIHRHRRQIQRFILVLNS